MIAWMIGAVLIAGLFIAIPLVRARRFAVPTSADNKNVAANVGLFQEQLDALKQQLADGEIGDIQFRQLEAELQKQLLLDARGAASEPGRGESPAGSARAALLLVVCMLLLPLLAVGLYIHLGSAQDVRIAELLEERVRASSEAEDRAIRGELLRRLMQELDKRPEHAAYLVTSARLLLEEENYLLAQSFYQRAATLLPQQPEILAEYAQASFFAAGNQLTPVAEAALEQALVVDPGNATALGLKGIGNFEAGDYRQAIANWKGAMERMLPHSTQARALAAGIEQAQKKLRTNGEEPPAPDQLPDRQSAVVHLALAAGLKADKDQIIYLFAREAGGGPMPLAVTRLRVADLPVTLTLDDSMAMPGGRRLSSAEKIQLVARVSQSGAVTPQAGDLEGKSGDIELAEAAKGVDLTIDTRL